MHNTYCGLEARAPFLCAPFPYAPLLKHMQLY